MSAPTLSVILVNWNTRALLQQCLGTLPRDEVAFEVLVVDNASSDGSAEMVKTEFPWVQLIASERNLGFSAGNNLAARRARGNYLLLLNPDTVVPPGTLRELVAFADTHVQGGAFGPALLNADGSRQRSCWRGEPGLKMALADALYLWRVPLLGAWFGSEYRPDELNTARTVDHLLGACILIRRETWAQVGELDEGYFLFLEETDWCVRARRSGWEVFFVPLVSITHLGQESMRLAPSKNLPQYYRSYLKFYRAHHAAPFGTELLKSIFAIGCQLRISMWWLRERRATTDAAQTHARNMRAGYQQVVSELATF